MNDLAFVHHVRSLGIELWLDGAKVRYRAPLGTLTPELLDALKRRKDGVRAILQLTRAGADTDPSISIIARAARERELPLSFAQRRQWFLSQLDPGSAAYNMHVALRLRGALDVRALERALQEMVRRHEVLRTRFVARDGEPWQTIQDDAAIQGATCRREDVAPEARDAEALRMASDEARRPFDLAEGRLVRTLLVRFDGDDHALIVTMHHIVSDAWSMGVLVQELGTLYRAFASDPASPPPLPPLPIQYADYAVWQHGRLSGERLEALLAYWRSRLAGAAPVLELPTDYTRPTGSSSPGARRELTLSAELAQGLAALARRANATMFMTLLAAFQVLLHRYSGQRDITVGAPIANRTRPELDGLVGFFVNTLALRTELAPELSFHELLARVRETALGAYEHQELPFEKLVEDLAPRRDPGRSPLFQVMFALQNAPSSELRLPGLSGTVLPAPSAAAKFDFSMTLMETDSSIRGNVEYRTDLFEDATIGRLIEHFRVLLTGIVARPEMPIGELPLQTDHERRELLAWGAASARDYPRDACVHELFELRAEQSPDAIALCDGAQTISYAALDARANRLARHLVERGVGPGITVGLCMGRSAAWIVSALAVLKAGGAYVPLDPSYPQARLAFMEQDARVALILRADAEDAIPEPARDAAGDAAENLGRRARADGPAYVMYTSGSTGVPKGVVVPHRAIVRLVVSTDYVTIGPEDTFLHLAPAAFDASTFEIWGALLNGARLALFTEERPTLAEIADAVERERVTILWLTAGLFHPMVEEQLHRLSGVRQLLAGGDVLRAAHVERVLAELPGCTLINGYGPTENTTFSTCHRMQGARSFRGSVPIGKPIANTRAYVLDPRMEPAPVGIAGELYLGGDGLALGYLNRPELTDEKFVPDPFGPPGSRLYRTGDRVRLRSDGALEFLGRVDHQVKLRGFRLELAEVQATILALPGVRECIALVREDRPGDARLVAYVVPEAGQSIDPKALRAALKERVPEFMIPSAFVALDAMPLNANQKVDRAALAASAGSIAFSALDGTLSRSSATLPRTDREHRLAALFREVLDVAEVGIDDDFFELGGHSLRATRVVSRLRSQLGVELPLRAFFEAPTIRALCERIEQVERATRDAMPALERIARDRPLPLSFAQQRLWFLDQLEPNRALYNIGTAVVLTGALDRGAFERSMAEIVRRHEVLRTHIRTVQGEPQQAIAAKVPTPLTVHRLHALETRETCPSDAEVQRWIADEVGRPFDLAQGPLFRAALLETGDQEHVLVLTMHHIVSDGWSAGVLIAEFGALYRAFVHGLPSPLDELPIQYADYAEWQRRWLAGELLDAQRSYWRKQLAGLAVLELPTESPPPAAPTRRGASRRVLVPAELSSRLAALGRGENATAFMTLLAAFQTLLHRYSGQDDVAVGSPIAGRTRPETEKLIGFFVNTLVLRGDLSQNPSFRELLRRTRETTLGAYAHQDLPFEKLVEDLAPDRQSGRSPLFQVMFALQNAPAPALELPGLSARALPIETAAAKFELALSLTETERGLEGTLEYSADRFDAAGIDRMLVHFETLLRGIADAPDRPIAELPLLTAAEREQQLVAWNGAAGSAREACIHELFEAQARRAPEALAVVFEGATLTYGALNRRANGLAHRLAALGVGPGTRVGLCAERSLDWVVGLLAILKAGGAYVPLDPTYPRERLAFMLRDAKLSVLITQTGILARGLSLEAIEHVVCLDAPTLSGEERGGDLPRRATAEDLAYVIYTSGSTGRPKGVENRHRGLVNLIDWFVREYGVGPDDRVAQQAVMGFDACGLELWPALSAGASVHIVDEETRLSAPRLIAWFDRQRITLAHLPPVLAEAVVEAELPETLSLRALLTGSDKVQRSPAKAPPFRYANHYGPTEASILATSGPIEPHASGESPPIGRPLDGVRVYLLDAHGELAPAGAVGELYIGGVGVGRGYAHRPDLTAERFVPDPFADEPGARMYRTGDLCRYRADGAIVFVGRADEQVKIRGFRIELGEVEGVLREHPAVRDAVAMAREDAAGEKRLVAYFVPHATMAPGERAEAAVEVRALRQHVESRLPAFMVPWAFIELEALPLTPNGKVDKKALPPLGAPRPRETEYIAPRGRVELELVAIWEEILGVRPIGVRDDFFALGGHSLSSVTLVATIEQRLGHRPALSQLFQGATVEKVAASLNERARPVSSVVTLSTSGAPSTPVAPSTSGAPSTVAQPPLVCIHAIGGSALSYRELAAALGAEQPMYAVHARGLEGDAPPRGDVREMARAYLAELAAANVNGPLRLAGWSFGAVIAHEMACQAIRAGHAVSDLVLIDPARPRPASESPVSEGHASEGAAAQASLLLLFAREMGLAPDELAAPAALETRETGLEQPTSDPFEHLVRATERRGLLPPGLGASYLRRTLRVYEAHRAAHATHRPLRYDGPARIVCAADGADPELDGRMSEWAPFLGSAPTVHRLPGSHFTLLRAPYVTELANWIRHPQVASTQR